MNLSVCSACGGFVPARAVCPHCGRNTPADVGAPPWAKLALAALSGSALSITLMACYGSPPCDPDPEADTDNDGYSATGDFCGSADLDCDDADADVHPGADDPEGDDRDQNCDGVDGIAGEGEGEGE